MSFQSLLNKTCTIYATNYLQGSHGETFFRFGIKYTNIPCRMRLITSQENVVNGKEKLFPTSYRIYLYQNYKSFPLTLTDIIEINNKQYDIVNINRCYGHHLEVDVIACQNPQFIFVINLAYEDGNIFTFEDGSHAIQE